MAADKDKSEQKQLKSSELLITFQIWWPVTIVGGSARWAAITAQAFVRAPQRRLDVTGFDCLFN